MSPPTIEPPPPGDPDVKTPEARPMADNLARARAINDLLATALAQVRDGLAFALRVMIANQFPENDGGRRLAENVFEAARIAVSGGKPRLADLVAAVDGLQLVANHLANHSLRFPGDLGAVREHVQKGLTALKQFPEGEIEEIRQETKQPG